MTARFPNMIGIMRTCIKTGNYSCEIPANKLCINVLRLLRDQGYIYGFSFVSPQKKYARLYPRVKIQFKFSDAATPVIRDLTIYKNTVSNFKTMHIRNQYQILSQHKLYLLSTTKGLVLTSFPEVMREKHKSLNLAFSGKLLLELCI
jgi:ribosomal protein S8